MYSKAYLIVFCGCFGCFGTTVKVNGRVVSATPPETIPVPAVPEDDAEEAEETKESPNPVVNSPVAPVPAVEPEETKAASPVPEPAPVPVAIAPKVLRTPKSPSVKSSTPKTAMKSPAYLFQFTAVRPLSAAKGVAQPKAFTIPTGTRVSVLEQSEAQGTTWYRTESKDVQGNVQSGWVIAEQLAGAELEVNP